MAVRFTLNDQAVEFGGDPAMPLLWYLRDHARLTGTKYACGIGACGACTVHVDGAAQRSCVTPLASLEGRRVATIEGVLAAKDAAAEAVRDAWATLDVPQCGWCQVGQMMAASDLIARSADPTDEEIAAISNLCRCGTYPRIRDAVRRAAKTRREGASS
jgi:isoquinoline 1-oxidoreductase alpha subunit